ncbi:site-specific integrase [Lentimicrobium sp. S6]|uniref:site-specific integrase n=1 Tax=Lentimicrobium sp. S6 TaxID=2735872 RepID=UPI001552FA13|nr:site-specific integrase [Lentimicrobium sp. S6]NPD48088.1 site-specific integrase [Lentimicrobium sp. S6]
MENLVSITPVFDRHKTQKSLKHVELYLYKKGIIRNYIRFGLTTLDWDKKKNRPKDIRDGFLMDEAIKEITEYCIHMESQNQVYDKKSIEEFLKTKKIFDVFNFYDFYQTRVLENQALKSNTRDNKNNLLKWLKVFAPGLNLYEIDYAFVSKFRSFLFEQKIQKSKEVKAPLRKNYIDSLEKHLKAALNIARKEGLIEKNPYENLKRVSERTKKDYLSRAELDILERLIDTIEPHYVPHLKKFLFGCYTGLRISDLRQLRKSHFRKEEEGWSIYLHRMYKVDKEVYLPLYSLFGGRAEKLVLEAG